MLFHDPQAQTEKRHQRKPLQDDNDSKAAVTINLSINEVIKNVLKALQLPIITGVLLALLFLSNLNNHGSIAWAASGGRMGGSKFSSSRRSKWSHSSSRSSSRRSKPSHSSSRRRSSSSYSASYSTPIPSPSSTANEDGSIFWGVIFLVAAYIMFQIVEALSSSSTSTPLARTTTTTTTEETNVVVKLQVGLLGMARSLQTDLNRIAETADTSTSQGLSYILQETILALLRHPDYCISGYSSVDLKKSEEECEKGFNQISTEERGKFDEETLVNVNNIRKQSTTSQTSGGFRNEYIVITIIVAASGVHKLPPINNSVQLKEALQKLASIPSSRILAVEVLWTPQKENDILTERELLENYSSLRPL